jgi:phosphoglycerate dehydrogenase-like enzyme
MKVLIFISWPVKAWSIRDDSVEELRRRFPDIEFVHARSLNEAHEQIIGADAAFTPFLTPDMVRPALSPRLTWVHSPAAAVAGLLPLRELAGRDILVTNSRGVQAIPIAEHVMGGLLVLSRKFDRMLDAQRERRWIQNDLVDDWPWLLHGRTMTIVGLGTIGIEVAKRANAFGMHVRGVRRRLDQPRPEFVERIVAPEDLDDVLPGTDVLVLSAPGVAGTQGMIDAERLALLNRGAVLVNVARAQIVDQSAMCDALASGQLGGAVLDVFEKEPLDEASELWSMPNVVVTPHSSGFRSTHWDDVIDMYAAELRRYLRGEPLVNVVDPAVGY